MKAQQNSIILSVKLRLVSKNLVVQYGMVLSNYISIRMAAFVVINILRTIAKLCFPPSKMLPCMCNWKFIFLRLKGRPALENVITRHTHCV